MNAFTHPTFSDPTSNLSVLLSFLPQLLSLLRITGCLNISARLLRKNVLDRQYLVKELKLLFRGTFVMISDSVSVVLYLVLYSFWTSNLNYLLLTHARTDT